ncbi:hypothetical protein ABIA32_000761 [Streptacidiphilus sp. MAP12-20]|uniref:DUF5955 family protein n=1 Tax=Streptacidiphilus sp. MAP12-20 TaxID=3156299 RepID=UPI0035114492
MSSRPGKRDNSIRIGDNASLTGVGIAAGDHASASGTASTGEASTPVPQTIDQLRDALAELLTRIQAADSGDMADAAEAEANAQALHEETGKEAPDKFRIKGLMLSLGAAVGGATVLTTSVTALAQAVRALFGI